MKEMPTSQMLCSIYHLSKCETISIRPAGFFNHNSETSTNVDESQGSIILKRMVSYPLNFKSTFGNAILKTHEMHFLEYTRR